MEKSNKIDLNKTLFNRSRRIKQLNTIPSKFLNTTAGCTSASKMLYKYLENFNLRRMLQQFKVAAFTGIILVSSASFAGTDSIPSAFLAEDTLNILDTSSLKGFSVNPKELFQPVEESIALTSFYENSLYPSHSFYQYWDTSALFPRLFYPPLERDTIKLVLQDKDFFCNYNMPIQGIVTSEYGMRHGRPHEGIDINLSTGDRVQAAFDGMVRVTKVSRGYGNVVVIRHHNGLETLYAHLSKILVKPGDVVNAGDVIAKGGNTGRSTGSHLHFELRFRGEALNPRHIVSFENNCLVSDSVKLVSERGEFRVIPLGIPFHKVKKGDYLYRIAHKYGISVDRLCRINGIRRNDILRVGQELRLQEINYAQTFKH